MNILGVQSEIFPNILDHTLMSNFLWAVHDNNDRKIQLHGQKLKKHWQTDGVNVWFAFNGRKQSLRHNGSIEHIIVFILQNLTEESGIGDNSVILMDNKKCKRYTREYNTIVKLLQIIFNDNYCTSNVLKKHIKHITFWKSDSPYDCGPFALSNYRIFLSLNGMVDNFDSAMISTNATEQSKSMRRLMSLMYKRKICFDFPVANYRHTHKQWYIDGGKSDWATVKQRESLEMTENERIDELKKIYDNWVNYLDAND